MLINDISLFRVSRVCASWFCLLLHRSTKSGWLEPREVASTIDLVAVVITLIPVLWSVVEEVNQPQEMWRSELSEFTSSKISHLKHHLQDGGEAWIRSDINDSRNAAVLAQGPGDHQRTNKNGCILSVKATGEGDLDIISRINQDGAIYMSRNGEPHDSLLTVVAYKYVRKSGQ